MFSPSQYSKRPAKNSQHFGSPPCHSRYFLLDSYLLRITNFMPYRSLMLMAGTFTPLRLSHPVSFAVVDRPAFGARRCCSKRCHQPPSPLSLCAPLPRRCRNSSRITTKSLLLRPCLLRIRQEYLQGVELRYNVILSYEGKTRRSPSRLQPLHELKLNCPSRSNRSKCCFPCCWRNSLKMERSA